MRVAGKWYCFVLFLASLTAPALAADWSIPLPSNPAETTRMDGGEWVLASSKATAKTRTDTYSHPAGHWLTLHSRSYATRLVVTATIQASYRAPLRDRTHVLLPSFVGKGVKLLSAAYGGNVGPWPSGWAHGNSSTWPGYGYSPIACFEDADGDGVIIIGWSDDLRSIETHYVTGPNDTDPHWFIHPDLDRGESCAFTFEAREYTGGWRKGVEYYREAYLLPWLERVGLPEAEYKAAGRWVKTNWPSWDGQSYQPGDLQKIVQRCRDAGATGYAQWSTADGEWYEPDHRLYPWYDHYSDAAKLVRTFGALVNPYIIDRTGRRANLAHPNTQAYLRGLRDDLARVGVTWVFWDTGSDPQATAPWDWLNVGLLFGERGIVVSAESAPDVWVAVVGSATFYPARSFAPVLPQIVTPHGTVFIMDHTSDGWIDPAEQVGIIPILTLEQLERRAK